MKFKVGDKVIVSSNMFYVHPDLTRNKVYTVISIEYHWVRVITDSGQINGWTYDFFEHAYVKEFENKLANLVNE